MPVAIRLAAAAEALGALAAYVRVEAGEVEVSTAIRERLRSVVVELIGAEPVIDGSASPVVGLARALLRQATDMVEHPGGADAWSEPDVMVLQGMGRMSMAIVDAFATAADTLDGLAECLGRPGATFLDVGTGTGWLAIATARRFGTLQVVGIDLYETALTLARANVAAEELDGRVRLRALDVTAMDESAVYDAVWLPLPFIPHSVIPAALVAATRALKPGGWLLAGGFAAGGDGLSESLADLRGLRSGGYPWSSDELLALFDGAGLSNTGVLERTWNAPVKLFVGRRPV